MRTMTYCNNCGECLHEHIHDNGKCLDCWTNQIGCGCDNPDPIKEEVKE